LQHTDNDQSQNLTADGKNDKVGSDEEDDDSDSSGYVLHENEVKKAWDTVFDSDDELLFCSRKTSVDISTLHPDPMQIFKLWQIYLDNFNPLLKVTHTPSLQKRIIDAASDVSIIDPPMEALMFSIYCVAIFTLEEGECFDQFQTPRRDLLSRYQLGAREALLNCGFLRTENRDCLTALHFYLVRWVESYLDEADICS
jgi:hypothetical protein